MKGHFVHRVAIFVDLIKGAPAAGSFDMAKIVEGIVQDEWGYIATGEFLFPAAHENPIDFAKLDDSI